MAQSKPISYSQIAEPNLLGPLQKELVEVNALLGVTEANLKGVVAEAAKIAKQTPLDSFENLEKVEKGLNDAKAAVIGLDKVEKDRLKLNEKINELNDERVKGNFALREQVRLQSKELRDNAKAAAASGDAYERLKKQTNDAQKEAKSLAAEFGENSKQAKVAIKRFEELDDNLAAVNKRMRDGRRDVGLYEKGTQKLTKAFKVFAGATVILKALELLQSSLASNSDGAAELEKIWVRVTAAFSVVAGRLVTIFPAILAKFERMVLGLKIGFAELKDLFSNNGDEVKELQKQYDGLAEEAAVNLGDAFKGLGEEIDDLTAKKIKLIDDTLAYRRQIVGLEQDVAALIPTQEKLRAGFEDDSTSLEEQIKNGVAFRAELVKRQAIEEDIASRRLKLAQENAAANKVSVDAQEELSSATLEYNQLVADQVTELVGTERELQKLRDDVTQLNLDFYIDDFDNRKTVNERIIADETQTFKHRNELLKENLKDTESVFDLEEASLNRSLTERGKATLDFDELRKKTNSEEVARVIREAGISEPLSIRALEVLRERRTFLQDNAEAQRDLTDAETESNILQDDIILQQRTLLALQEKGVDIAEVLKTLSDERLQSDIDNIRDQLSVAEEGSQRFIALNKDLNDKLLDQNQVRIDEEKKQLDDLGKSADTAFQVLSDITEKRAEKRLEGIDDEIAAEEKRADRLSELAAEGNEDAENNLAISEQRQAQLELEREQQLKRQKQSELALTAIQTYGGKVTAGDPTPLASTISDIAVLSAFVNTLPGFFEGTENTGSTGALKDSHGAITGFTHENERVIKAEQNRIIGNMSNAELTMLAHKENTKTRSLDSSRHVVQELQDLKRITKEKPVYLGSDFDSVSDLIIKKVKTGNKLERLHKKSGGIWA